MLTDSEIRRRQQRGVSFRLVPPIDWRATLRTRANILVTGPKEVVAAFLHTAQSELREPIRSYGLVLPLCLDGIRTVILTDVARLDEANQQRLRQWFDQGHNADVQVISVASEPLFSLVTANAFDADLYYRLNTILLEMAAL